MSDLSYESFPGSPTGPLNCPQAWKLLLLVREVTLQHGNRISTRHTDLWQGLKYFNLLPVLIEAAE